MAANPELRCPCCKHLAVNHATPHCKKRLCGWLICKKCKFVYTIP